MPSWWCPLFPGSEKKWKCTILVQDGWGHLETGVAPRRRHELGFQAGGSWKRWLCPLSSRPYFLWPFFLWASFSSLVNEETIVPHSVILKIKQFNIPKALKITPGTQKKWVSLWGSVITLGESGREQGFNWEHTQKSETSWAPFLATWKLNYKESSFVIEIDSAMSISETTMACFSI